MSEEALKTRAHTLDLARKRLFPKRMEMFGAVGLDLVIGRREGYRFWDLDGREFQDLDLVGGLYNLGHRNPDLTAVLRKGLDEVDLGQAFFPSPPQAELAEKLATSTGLQYVVFAPSGTEANDVTIRSARRQTGRRKVVSCGSGYHGAAGLASAAGDASIAASFHSDYSDEFLMVPVNDLEAIEQAVGAGDVAALVLEPATNASGYPEAPAGFFAALRALCDRTGTVFVFDEVVTGLGRSGSLWGVERHDVRPDVLTIGKGLSGGIYPLAATILSADAGAWLERDLFGYAGSFAGGDLACLVGNAVFDRCSDPATLEHVEKMSRHVRTGLESIQSRRPVLSGIRQFGFLYGLELEIPDSNLRLMGALFAQGLFANIAGHTSNVLNLKPGLLVDEAFCDEALQRIDDALGTF